MLPNDADDQKPGGKGMNKGRFALATWLRFLRWRPSSEEEMLAAEKRLLSLLRTPHTLQRVDIGPPRPTPEGARQPRGGGGSRQRSSRYINTVSFQNVPAPP
eukprot:jgi/Mesen1/3864/ME000207S02878